MNGLPESSFLPLVIGGVVLILLLCLLVYARAVLVHILVILRSFRQISDAAADEAMNPSEKSLNDVTRLLLPLIQKDFPDFSWPDLRKQTENAIRSAMLARSTQDLSLLSGLSDRLRTTVGLRIRDDKAAGIRKRYENIRIHRTAITDYRNRPGRCEIRLSTSLGYETDGPEKSRGTTLTRAAFAPPSRGAGTRGGLKKVETVAESVLVHIQSLEREGTETRITSGSCPHCGAPMQSADAKKCPYCGGALTQYNIRVWSLESVELGNE